VADDEFSDRAFAARVNGGRVPVREIRGPVNTPMTYSGSLQVQFATKEAMERFTVLEAISSMEALPMILHCPLCSYQHVDKPDLPEWDNRPHREHLCHACGHLWTPALIPTTGVTEL
jgi:hypothetical protein